MRKAKPKLYLVKDVGPACPYELQSYQNAAIAKGAETQLPKSVLDAALYVINHTDPQQLKQWLLQRTPRERQLLKEYLKEQLR